MAAKEPKTSSAPEPAATPEPAGASPAPELGLLAAASPSLTVAAPPQEWVEAVLVVSDRAVLSVEESGLPAVFVVPVCDSSGELVASPASAVAQVRSLFAPASAPTATLPDDAEGWDVFVEVEPGGAFLGTFRPSLEAGPDPSEVEPSAEDAPSKDTCSAALSPQRADVAVSVSVIYLSDAAASEVPLAGLAWVPKGEADLSRFVPAVMLDPSVPTAQPGPVPSHVLSRLSELDHVALLSSALSPRSAARVLHRVRTDADGQVDSDASAAA